MQADRPAGTHYRPPHFGLRVPEYRFGVSGHETALPSVFLSLKLG